MSQQTVAETEGKVRVAAYLPEDLVKALKHHAVENDTNVTEIMERLVRKELGIKAESRTDPQAGKVRGE